MRVFMTPELRQRLDEIAEAAAYPLGGLMRAAVAAIILC